MFDSEHLQDFFPDGDARELYGYMVTDRGIVDDVAMVDESNISSNGAYVLLEKRGDSVTISQDFIGSYGLHYYEQDGYYALSNSFLVLVDYLKKDRRITLNEDFANYLIGTNLFSESYSETLVSEIRILDRRAKVRIDVPTGNLRIDYVDYQENTVQLDSPEGMEILDAWRYRWAGLLEYLLSLGCSVRSDLSGGFDSRMVLSLFAGSDMNGLMKEVSIFSKKDNLHSHESDYAYATKICSLLGLELNNESRLSRARENREFYDAVSTSFYTNLGFHNEMVFRSFIHCNRRFRITGCGGECIRNFWTASPDEHIESAIRLVKGYPLARKQDIETSTRRVLESAFDEMSRMRSSLGRPIPPSELTHNLCRDTGCRNHFGRTMTEQHFLNTVTLNPLLDCELHRLKLTTDECTDRNLLPAVIIGRYYPELLDMDFEGGRSIDEETIKQAQLINDTYPVNTSHRATSFEEYAVSLPEAIRPNRASAVPLSNEDIDAAVLANYMDGPRSTISKMYGEEPFLASIFSKQGRPGLHPPLVK